MSIFNLNISYNKSIGEISETRLGNLKKEFSEYTDVKRLDNTDLYILKNDVNGLVIGDSQISFVSSEIKDETVDIEDIKKILDRANDTLELSDKTSIAIKFEGIDKTDKEIMKLSKEKHLEESNLISAQGVGYRFIVENDEFYGNIKIEPYVNDTDSIYYYVELLSKNSINLNEAKQTLVNMMEVGLTNTKEVSQKLFINNK